MYLPAGKQIVNSLVLITPRMTNELVEWPLIGRTDGGMGRPKVATESDVYIQGKVGGPRFGACH